jgi:hypothetical protein
MDLFGIRKRRRRRRPQDPAKIVGSAVGKGIATVLVGALVGLFRKK